MPPHFLKQRSRLYSFLREEMAYLGSAIQTSRLNFYGSGKAIVLEEFDKEGRPGLEYLTGMSPSSVNPVELGMRQSLTLDVIVTLWVALSSGQRPLNHPVNQHFYSWTSMGNLLELNLDLASEWNRQGLFLRSIVEVAQGKIALDKAPGPQITYEEFSQEKLANFPAPTEQTYVSLRDRNSRLYRFSPKEADCFGLAVRNSRLNFFGPGKRIVLQDLQALIGLSPSIVSKTEWALQAITLDVIVTLWIAMGSGYQPLIHPIKKRPYTWVDIGEMLELNEETAARWKKKGLTLRSLNELAENISHTLLTSNPAVKLPQVTGLSLLVQSIQEVMRDRHLDEIEFAKFADVPLYLIRGILSSNIDPLDIDIRSAKLLYSATYPPKEISQDRWSFGQFIELIAQ